LTNAEQLTQTEDGVTRAASLGEVVRSEQEMAGSTQSRMLFLGFVPIGILLLGFFLIPLMVMVLYSFWQTDGFHVVPNWTLKNYEAFLGWTTYTRVIAKTVAISLSVTVLALLVGYPFAYFLVRHVKKSLQLPLLVLVIIPFWTSYLLRVYAWMGILGRKGLINQALMTTGIIKEPLSFLLYNNFSVFIVFLYLYLPFVVIALYATLEKFDFAQVDAAMDLGARPWRAFLEITLPQTKQGLITAFIFVFIPMLGEYIAPKLVGGTSGTMIAVMIVNLFRGFQFPQGAAVALGIAAFIIVLLFMLRRHIRIEEMY
jgi:spermidine/putrescine transport system permease protein